MAEVIELTDEHNCLWCLNRDAAMTGADWIMVSGCLDNHIQCMYLCHRHKNEAVDSISLHGMYCTVDYSHMIEEAIFSSDNLWDDQIEVITLCHCEGGHHPEGAHSVAMRMVS